MYNHVERWKCNIQGVIKLMWLGREWYLEACFISSPGRQRQLACAVSVFERQSCLLIKSYSARVMATSCMFKHCKRLHKSWLLLLKWWEQAVFVCFSLSVILPVAEFSVLTKLVLFYHSKQTQNGFELISCFFLFVFREGNSSEDAEDLELNSVGREDDYARRFSLGIEKKRFVCFAIARW